MSKDGKGITCGMEPWSIRQFCGVPAASVSMQHTVDRSLQVKARALVTFSRIAAGAMFDANLARRGRRHGPGLVQVRPKGRHLRGNGQVRSDVGCASGHDIRVHESRNRLSMTSTEIEQNEMSPAALGPAVDGDRRQPWPPRSLNASCGWFVLTSPPGPAKANWIPSCWPTSSSRRNCAGRSDRRRSGSGRAVEALTPQGGVRSRSGPA